MENLNFHKIDGDRYESDEIVATSAINIHLDREEVSNFQILVKTSGNDYAKTTYLNQKNVDVEISGNVFPKSVKVISYSEVINATVTRSSETDPEIANLMERMAAQERINSEQQAEIDNNTRINSEQQQISIDEENETMHITSAQ